MFTPVMLLDPDIISRLNKQAEKSKRRKFFFKEPTPEVIPTSYRVYIKSRFWRKRRNQYFDLYGKRCVVCGTNKYVQLHHKIYRNYGKENDKDLMALCRFHHNIIHQSVPLAYNMSKETDSLVQEMKIYQNYYNRNKEEHLQYT